MRKGEDTERILYNKVRNNEISRQQREQSVKRMERDLQKLKDDNSRKLNQEAIEASRSETELAQKLYREQAELLKVCGPFIVSVIRFGHLRTSSLIL